MREIPESIDNALAIALKSLNTKKVKITISSLLKQLAAEIKNCVITGDWNSAVKFSYYCHEIAKLSNCHEWFDVFLEIRKMRDEIEIILGTVNG